MSDHRANRVENAEGLSQQKFMESLDEHCRSMIVHSSFFCIATLNADGSLDVSPRGDPPGSVVVLDSSTLLLPDRRGNNRLDSLTNATERSCVALLFLVPGVLETLRVTGSAEVIHDDVRLEACAVDGNVPRTGLLVTVAKACLQCGKAVKRGGLWDETYRISRSELPSFGTMLVEQTDTTVLIYPGQTALVDDHRNLFISGISEAYTK